MKKLITILLLFNVAYGQLGYLKPNNSYGTRTNRVAPDSVLHLPLMADTSSLYSTQPTWPQIRQAGDSLWYWNSHKWNNLSLAGKNIYDVDGTLKQNRVLNGGGKSLDFTNLLSFSFSRNDGTTYTQNISNAGNIGTRYLNRAAASGRGSDAYLDTTKTYFGYFNPSVPGVYVSYLGLYQDSLTIKSSHNIIHGYTETDGLWEMFGDVSHYGLLEAASSFSSTMDTYIGNVTIEGSTIIKDAAATPASPIDGTTVNMYLKGGKIIYQYNDAGTIRYKYLDLTGTGTTWVHTTVAP